MLFSSFYLYEKNSLIATLSILLVNFPAFLLILQRIFLLINYKKLEKKYIVNKSCRNIDIKEIKKFSILKINYSMLFSQYVIVDSNNNLIFKIFQNGNFGKKYVICDNENKIIGKIDKNLFSFGDFVVKIVNEQPFMVCPKLQLSSNYKVIGRDYYVKGDVSLIKNVILDNENNEVAYVESISKKNNRWHSLGNAKVILNEKVKNNIDIMVLSLCIILGNLEKNK